MPPPPTPNYKSRKELKKGEHTFALETRNDAFRQRARTLVRPPAERRHRKPEGGLGARRLLGVPPSREGHRGAPSTPYGPCCRGTRGPGGESSDGGPPFLLASAPGLAVGADGPGGPHCNGASVLDRAPDTVGAATSSS